MALAPGFVPLRSRPSLFPSLMLRRITRRRFIEENKVLNQNEEPPPSLTEKHITDRLVPAPVFTLHSNELIPRHYLAVENHRLYPFTIDAKPQFDHYVRHIPTPLDYTLLITSSGCRRKAASIRSSRLLLSLQPERPLPDHAAAAGQAGTSGGGADACFRIMDGYNPTAYLSAVEYVYRDFTNLLEASQDRWLIERSLPDYIYRTEDLVQLRGNAYKTSAARSTSSAVFTRITASNGSACNMRTASAVSSIPGCATDFSTSGDAIAISLHGRASAGHRARVDSLRHARLEGLCLFINERLEGFTFGERITPDVANVLVENQFAIPGSAHSCSANRQGITDCTFINVGDDLGLKICGA
jgi:hypothetical protein